MSLNELEVGSQEWEAEIARLQNVEDAANGIAEPKAMQEGKTDPDIAEKEAAEGAVEQEAKQEVERVDESAPEAPPKAKTQPTPEKLANPEGVLSKDGKVVLSYGILAATRRDREAAKDRASLAEAKVSELEQQLADIKAGKNAEEVEPLTEQELTELSEYDPRAAKAYKAAQDKAELAIAKASEMEKNMKPAQKAEFIEDPVQEAIDSIPVLAEWQATDAAKFNLAVEHDKLLRAIPKWQGTTPELLQKRFAEVVRRTSSDLEIEETVDAPQTKPTSKADPAKVIAEAKRTAPNTLSDFKGGSGADTDDRMDRLTPQRQLNRMNGMSDADIDKYLAKLG